ncbi:MAG: hypothetical protein D6731_15090, partial [Planctomycetota bacterium]
PSAEQFLPPLSPTEIEQRLQDFPYPVPEAAKAPPAPLLFPSVSANRNGLRLLGVLAFAWTLAAALLPALGR